MLTFRTGALLYAGLILMGLMATMVGAPPPGSSAQGAPVLRFMGFSPQTPPADSLAFRQAVARAIDREAVIRGVSQHLRATARAAMSIQHPNLPGYNPSLQALPYDPVRARELLAQSGWTGPITILVGRSTDRFLIAFDEAVAESIRKTLAANVTVQQVASFATLTRAAYAGSAAVYMFAWVSDARDFGYPSFALGIARDVVSDPEARALAEKRDVEAAERLLLEKVLIVPIIYY